MKPKISRRTAAKILKKLSSLTDMIVAGITVAAFVDDKSSVATYTAITIAIIISIIVDIFVGKLEE